MLALAYVDFVLRFRAYSEIDMLLHLESVEDCLVRLARTELSSPSEMKWSPFQMRIILRACAVALVVRMHVACHARPKGKYDIKYTMISNADHATLSTTIWHVCGKEGVRVGGVFRELEYRMKGPRGHVLTPSPLVRNAEEFVLRHHASKIDETNKTDKGQGRLPCLICSARAYEGGGGQFCRHRFCSVGCRDRALNQELGVPTLHMQTKTRLHDVLLGFFAW